MIAIVDYDSGNLHSVVNTIGRLGYQASIHIKEYRGKGAGARYPEHRSALLREYMTSSTPTDGGGQCCGC